MSWMGDSFGQSALVQADKPVESSFEVEGKSENCEA